MDGAGVVETLGPGVTGLAAGDRVYLSGTAPAPLNGTYAERALCAAAQAHPLPSHLTFAQGAAVNVAYATAYRAIVDRARAQPGETILVHGGSGGVGIASIQIARAMGMTVLATAGTARGRALVVEQGAHQVFDHHGPDYLAGILAAAGGVDVIIEMIANVNLDKDLGPAGAQRPRRGGRQPGPRGDRRQADHGARCGDSGHDADERHAG